MTHLEAPHPRSEAAGVPDIHAAAPLDVLVADDDPAARTALCAAVVALGHRCRGAADGLEALAAYEERRPDVIVTNLTMPGIDGIELCRRVRARDTGTYTYILLTSGHARKRDFVNAVHAGADDYLSKPLDLDDLEARLIAAGRIVGAYRQLAERNVALRHDRRAFFRAARIDPLTHIANRLRLEEDLVALQAQVSLRGDRATVAMCDLDQFKRYNDRYGHLAGDRALQRIAQAIRASLRRADRVYRFGGEEFLVVLPKQDPEGTAAVLERARSAVARLAIPHAGGARLPVLTMSVGMASVDGRIEGSVRDAIARADKALYVAKADGGNTVRIAAV